MMVARIDAKGILLADLLAGLGDISALPLMVVRGLALDSRLLQAGEIFLACRGTQVHGLQHLDQALHHGAAAVLAETDPAWPVARVAAQAAERGVPLVMVPNLGRKVGVIAARFFGNPALAMRMLGVTGTNGKTSITHFIAQALGKRAPTAVIGTLGNGFPGDLNAATHTTPDPVRLHAELARLLDAGARVVAMEVSSHALDQRRVVGIPFHTAVFSNLSQDHQDYHTSMAAYAQAKARLLHTPGLMLAVVNADDAFGVELLRQVGQRIDTVACGSAPNLARLGDHYVQVRSVRVHAHGMHIEFDSSWGAGAVHSHLLGRFNVENLMLVLGVLLAWDMPLSRAITALQALNPVPGRMTSFVQDGMPVVVVDYAHTPDALEKVLLSLREHARGELICVFGCGGDRDRGKRPLMGEIARRLADRVVLTNDNPRSENPAHIIQDILAGIDNEDGVLIEKDRARAIQYALHSAADGDVVLVAGKGHETWQQVGDLKLPFSDVEQVRKALRERGA